MKSMKKTGPAFWNTAVKEMVPLTSLYDPDSNIEQLRDCLDCYSHHVSAIRVQVGYDYSAKETIMLAHRYNIPTSTRIRTGNTVTVRGVLPVYFDLCAGASVSRIQCRMENLQAGTRPREVIVLADDRNLDVQFEFDNRGRYDANGWKSRDKLLDTAKEWLDSGAVNLVAGIMEPRKAAGSFILNLEFAEQLASLFGLHAVMFKAPNERAQDTLLAYFGEETHLCDVSLSNVARVEKQRDIEVASFTSSRRVDRPFEGDQR